MKIRFKEDVGVTMVRAVDKEEKKEEKEETFYIGDELSGDVISDNGEYVSFESWNYWQIHGLKKSQFEIVDLVTETLHDLWKVPLYDIDGQKKVLRKMLNEYEKSGL